MRRSLSLGALIGTVCLAGAATVLGCGGDDDSTPAGIDAGSDATTAVDSGLPAIDAAAKDAGFDGGEVLSDDQIVQVLHVANQGEVNEGTVAETHAVTATIQSLATEFVQMHGSADTALLAAAGDAGLAGVDSTTSTMLQEQGVSDQTGLNAASGVTFDELYYNDQLRTHQTVYAIITNQLLPQVRSPALKAQVQAAQTMVAMHLQELQAIEVGDAGVFDAGDAGSGDDAGGDGGELPPADAG